MKKLEDNLEGKIDLPEAKKLVEEKYKTIKQIFSYIKEYRE